MEFSTPLQMFQGLPADSGQHTLWYRRYSPFTLRFLLFIGQFPHPTATCELLWFLGAPVTYSEEIPPVFEKLFSAWCHGIWTLGPEKQAHVVLENSNYLGCVWSVVS